MNSHIVIDDRTGQRAADKNGHGYIARRTSRRPPCVHCGGVAQFYIDVRGPLDGPAYRSQHLALCSAEHVADALRSIADRIIDQVEAA